MTYSAPAGSLVSGDSFSGSLTRLRVESVAGSRMRSTGAALTAGNNYDLTYVSNSLSITRKSATVSAVANTKVYGSPDPSLATTDSGFLAADVGVGKITFSASRAPGESVAGSPYTITASASDGATALLTNYAVTYNPANFTITQANQTISFTAPAASTYGDADSALGATATSGLTVGYASTTTSVCTIVGGKLHVVAAGTCTITASQPGDSNYFAAANVVRTFSIAKKALFVQAEASPLSVQYSDPLAMSGTITGFAYAETLASSGVTGSPACTSPAVSSGKVTGGPARQP